MTLNSELFVDDPLGKEIPNLGVSKVGLPTDEKEWDVLRYELSSFVCDGQYEGGLDRILSTYLRHLDQAQQPAVWISGFYGSGKSHLVRVLEHLWTDVRLPDGSSARGVVEVSQQISDHLRELSTVAKRGGGLWAAAGTLGAGAGSSVRLAFLSILFRAAGLPEQLAPAQCALWLRAEGIFDVVRDSVEADGQDLEYELRNLYVSRHLANAILRARPDFAASPADVRKQLRAQFPPDRTDISDADMLAIVDDILYQVSTQPGRMPCVLVVLDEMQQFIADDPERALAVQNLVEACSSRLGARLLVVATGQSALQSTATLQKLTDRFSVQIQLSDADVESVIRRVILQKRSDKIAELGAELNRVSGEIDRQLAGAKIAPRPDDQSALVPDYPLLPSRRRLWEEILRAVDKGGKAGQLRSQLKVVHEANRQVARKPVGTVVPADFIYEQQAAGMLQSGALLREVEELIQSERSRPEDGPLRSRILALVFLLSQLPREGFADTGVRTTAAHIADLLVDDLAGSGEQLRRDVPRLLEALRDESKLQRLDEEYHLQTRAGQEWNKDFQGRLNTFLSDPGSVAAARDKALREAVTRLAPQAPAHGASKTPRKLALHFGDVQPALGDVIPVWVRNGWDITEKQFRDAATGAGQESPIIFVYLPKYEPDALRQALGELSAAQETLDTRPRPTTDEGLAAQRAMQSTRDIAEGRVNHLIREVIGKALVVQAGGNRVDGADLATAIDAAVRRALDRMYHRFAEADHASWGSVVTRAQQGNGDPLGAVGYNGDPAKHRVCAAVLSAVSATSTPGSEVRKLFEAAPYGWPRDAIHGALLALVVGGHLTAEENGLAVTARDLTPAKIGKTSFRREQASVTVATRLAVRQLLTNVGVPWEPNEEAAGCARLLQKLSDLAQSIGGEPPLPPRPAATFISSLQGLKGNDLIVAVFEQRDALLAQSEEWTGLQQLKQPRLDAYRLATQLREHARGLDNAVTAAQQLDAILKERRLLDQPDPVAPVIKDLTTLLRAAIRQHVASYADALTSALNELDTDDIWCATPEEQRRQILQRHDLVTIPEPDLGSPSAVLAAIDQQSLSAWTNRVDAIPARVQQAREAAAKLIEPKSVRINPPSATLRTPDDVEEYVNHLRAVLSDALETHGSLII